MNSKKEQHTSEKGFRSGETKYNSIKSSIIKQKFKRKSLNLETKLDIIKQIEAGVRVSHVAKSYRLPESTVRTIRNNGEKIKILIDNCSDVAAENSTKTRNVVIAKTEKLLCSWLDEQNHNITPISSTIIRKKALEFFEDIKNQEMISPSTSLSQNEKDLHFTASKGWYERFKKRHTSQDTIKALDEAKSTNLKNASIYSKQLKEIIATEGYSPCQVFNADEMVLNWKRMPCKIFTSKQKEIPSICKSSGEKLTLLLCSNAEGDFKFKPLLIYTAENPRALREISKSSLSIYWKSNRRGIMTSTIFEEWFLYCFCLETEMYCKSMNIPFKVLLIIDDAPTHLSLLNEMHPNVKVFLLPSNNIAPLIQPMNQGILSAFKRYYYSRAFQQILNATSVIGNSSILEYWKQYSVLDAIKNIEYAWYEIKNSSLNAVWKKLWPECCKNEVTVEMPEIFEFVNMGKKIGRGFEVLEPKELIEFLDRNDENLFSESHYNQRAKIERESEDEYDNTEMMNNDEEEIVIRTEFNYETLKEFLELADKLSQDALSLDSNIERSERFCQNLSLAIAPYKELYQKKKEERRQPPITAFFKKL